MHRALVALALASFLVQPLLAEDSAPQTQSPTLVLDEILRPRIEVLENAQEDAEYFNGKTERAQREQVVAVKQTRLSLEKSLPDMRIIFLLTVFASDGECYGQCTGKTRPTEGQPDKASRVSEFLLSEINIHVIELKTLEEEEEYFSGETDRSAREILVRAFGTLETLRLFSQNSCEDRKVVVHMLRVHTPSGECYGECDVTEAEEPLPPKNEA